jgi:hypothetical protein
MCLALLFLLMCNISNRKNPGIFDGILHGVRHAIGNLFAKVKKYRSGIIVCRYDKITLILITLSCIPPG